MGFVEFQERLESLALQLSVSSEQDQALRRVVNELERIRFTELEESWRRKVEGVATTLFSILDELT